MAAMFDESSGDTTRICWICYESGQCGVDDDTLWVTPCRCRGSLQWVHQACIRVWIDQKQEGYVLAPVKCAQCQAEYRLDMSGPRLLCTTAEMTDMVIDYACPVICVTFILATVYSNLIGFGMLSVVQVMGPAKGYAAIKNMRVINVVFGLPLIPLALIVPRLVQPRITIRRRGDGVGEEDERADHDHVIAVVDVNLHPPDGLQRMSLSRAIVGGLLLPFLSSVTGRALFSRWIREPWKQAAAGAVAYLVTKRLYRIAVQYQEQALRQGRRILPYVDEALSR